ncbi:cathepsin L-like [Aricia agestis]|uniref:cathepsin L-like n=1 Tax=Aricia agestis TaxID=91739 RepID=UPI001C20B425|nr:cathepsin L-like [Aricia agestis]
MAVDHTHLFIMQLLLLITHLYFVASNPYINETAHKLKYILSCRHTRCVPRLGMNVDSLAEKTLKAMRNTDRLSEYLSVFNVSDCDGEASADYVRRHVLDGLLTTDDVPETHWNEYKSIYNKKYVSQTHEEAALSVWKNNLRKVAEHNQLYLSGKRSYTLHLNMFGDWPIMSYVEDLLKLIWTIPLYDPARDPHRTAYKRNLHQKIPREMDWRDRGYKPRLEEQYHCGACYAFAITHALQAQVYKHHGDWRELSPQQIVDCSLPDGNQGCNGGSLEAALRYASRAGLIRESYYPYRGKRGHCHYRSAEVSARPRRWATLPAGDERAIERALATIGPMAVAVNAEPFTFQLYRSGIYDDPFCVPWKMNHAMLLVGYTPEYWVLLNWWGRHWGEGGYMRIRRGHNVCGVANMATYVEL